MKFVSKSLYQIRLFVDIIVILFAFPISILISYGDFKQPYSNEYIYVLIILLIGWVWIANKVNLYDMFRSRNLFFEYYATLKVIFSQLFIILIIIIFVGEIELRKRFILVYPLTILVFFFSEKFIMRYILEKFRKKGRNQRSIIIIGAGLIGQRFHDAIKNNPQFGYKFIGFVDDKGCPADDKYLGKIEDLKNILSKKTIHDVIIALPNYAFKKIKEIIRTCEQHTVRIRIIPDYFDFFSSKLELSQFSSFPILTVRQDQLNDFSVRLIKRIFDIVFTILIATSFSWLFFTIAIFIKLDSKGPIFFKAERWGRNNEKFFLHKFRSMYDGVNRFDDSGKYLQTKPNDSRVTRVGKFLRKTNLDELPQFINVLLGQMSVVGPRPHSTPLNEESKEVVDKYMQRHLVKPGVTGWAQVNGYRGQTDSLEKMTRRVEHDLWYIENWSFQLDLYIIYQTVLLMLTGDKEAY